MDHWYLLSTRLWAKLSHQGFDSFADGLRIFPTNDQVPEYNNDYLISLNKPCVQAFASDRERGANEAKADEAAKIHSKILSATELESC